MDLIQVSTHSWYAHSRIYEYNSGLIESDGLVWLIDPGMAPDEVLSIKDFCLSRNWQIQAVLITHFHFDHVLGVNAFDDAIRVAHNKFMPEYSRMKESSRKAIAGLISEGEMEMPAWGWEVSPDWEVNRTQSFLINDLEILVLPLPGHTADQVGLYIPQDRTLFAADTLSDIEIAFLSYDSTAYQKSLERVIRYPVERIIPGHGNPSANLRESQERINRDLDYIRYLRKVIKRMTTRGASLSEVRKACMDLPILKPEDNRNSHIWNIESVFLEMGGDAKGENVGWNREWD
jgi:glyoxylase-like metal-dependent hydrolase (beta-lactamase superfamily II)